ncbi:hypothetical protein [Bacillus massiliigorillae]|uniref:hypothetical protein n=1 Tax=Bacillus massiliigorillae TaxID=1243664 RepID=UPI0003AAEE71|nr:hypothetical protein [Bacillus massiliigorillae]
MDKKKIIKRVLLLVGLFVIQFAIFFIKERFYTDSNTVGIVLWVLPCIMIVFAGYFIQSDKAWNWGRSLLFSIVIAIISVAGVQFGENTAINKGTDKPMSSNLGEPKESSKTMDIGADDGKGNNEQSGIVQSFGKEVTNPKNNAGSEDSEQKSYNYDSSVESDASISMSNPEESTDKSLKANSENSMDNASDIDIADILMSMALYFMLAFAGQYVKYNMRKTY